MLQEIGPRAFVNRPALWRETYPWPRIDGHKYTRGHAVVVSGPAESTGAARMGARGALRVGAGLVTVVGLVTATAVNATHLTAVMVKGVGSDGALTEFLSDVRRNVALIGPGAGVGAGTAATVSTVLASPATAVLDADALTSFAPGEAEQPVRATGFGFVVRGAEPGPTPDSPPCRYKLPFKVPSRSTMMLLDWVELVLAFCTIPPPPKRMLLVNLVPCTSRKAAELSP